MNDRLSFASDYLEGAHPRPQYLSLHVSIYNKL